MKLSNFHLKAGITYFPNKSNINASLQMYTFDWINTSKNDWGSLGELLLLSHFSPKYTYKGVWCILFFYFFMHVVELDLCNKTVLTTCMSTTAALAKGVSTHLETKNFCRYLRHFCTSLYKRNCTFKNNHLQSKDEKTLWCSNPLKFITVIRFVTPISR